MILTSDWIQITAVESEADHLCGVVDTVVPEPAVNTAVGERALKAFVKGSKRRDKGFPYCAPTT